jgi:hypothetical protein
MTYQVGGAGTFGFTGVIPAENGFFAQATGAGASLQMPASARVHSANPFLKESIANLLKLSANSNGYIDEMLVHFNNDATAGIDEYDGSKLAVADAPQLYSVVNGNALTINTFPVAGNEVVDLGFTSATTGEHSFTATGIETFDPTTPILLEDMQLNSLQDLRQNPVYSFSYVVGENANRFKLHFKSVNGINDLDNSGITVFSYDHNVVINNTTSQAGEVWIYDMTGRELSHTSINSLMKTSIPMQAAIGTYMVKVVTAKASVNHKVFIR